MKKTYYPLLAAVFLLGSCDLDREPKDTLADSNYFNNRVELETFTNGLYSIFPTASDIYGETADVIIPVALSEEVLGTRTVPTTGGGWTWTSLSYINFFLANSNRCPDAQARAEYDAVARFFRAYFYFDKVKRFGEVPWFDAPLTSTDDKLYEPRTARDVLMANILADVDYAIANLPTAANLYRVTKWTALALKSRIFLFEGTFRKYHGISGYQTYLTYAADAAKDFIDNSPYSLYTTGTQPYRDLFAANSAKGQEVILARNYNLGLNIVHSANQYFISGGARPGLNKKIVDSYLKSDGSRFTATAGYGTMQYYDEMQNRDPRLAQTIVAPGYTRIGGTQVLSPSFSSATTGYQIIKWVTDAGQDNYNKGYNDFILFRAAEVYLNYAEAKAELGSITQTDLDVSITPIRTRAGMPALNLATANANPDPYLEAAETGYPNVTGANKGVILEIRRERTIELLAEGFRYYDIMRWKEGKTFEKPFKGMYFSAIDPVKHFTIYDLNGNGAHDALDLCIYDGTKPTAAAYPELTGITKFLQLNTEVTLEHGTSGGNVIHTSSITRQWTESRDYLYPIPQSQITLYGGRLSQNPNW